ncbi:hypothetical protein [Lignipirellula cremea]|uniref:Uncharacterized protein n=1 Tax=Lignipirellula cremea TaxID=2528010 RepID=A0A518DTU8_9BACT|nr:hypothetical protein [Lignipirellula cremea]QDU95254.1 hypothetical protein Pla8534_30690 [Lignipirellula cremea]
MPKPEFTNLQIDFWRHQGKLGVTLSSLCLFQGLPPTGTPILAALQELASEPPPVQRLLTFVPCDRPRPLTSLRLQLVPPREELQVLSIRYEGQAATIEMTAVGRGLAEEAVAAWMSGAEDFCVSPRHARLKKKAFGLLDRQSSELWFWGPDYYAP